MAATKRLVSDRDAGGDVAGPSKKQKVSKASSVSEKDDGAAATNIEKKQKKKEKKEKKENKEKREEGGDSKDKEERRKEKEEEKKKRKEAKREKKRQEEEQKQGQEASPKDISNTEEHPEKERSEEKKEKKEKKKKAKKDKSEKSEATTSKANGGDTEGSPAQNGTQAHNGAYKQTPSLSALPQSVIDAFLAEQSISIDDPHNTSPSPRPVLGFEHLPSTDLLRKSPFAAYKTPTPIQAASWPFTLSGRDVIGVAETGSGKTMAFALPCVESILKIKNRSIKAVVVSPTRELAMQTHEQTVQLASHVGLKCVCIYGGASKDEQRTALRKGADIIIATPGRLRDFMSDGTISLADARFAVLDEADRMLDKGFEDDIKDILGSMAPREARQTLMFTATWPASVRTLAATFMVDPVKITIGSSGKETANGAVELQANSRITQHVEVLDSRSKEQRLLQILKKYHHGAAKDDRILVFCLYKKEATRVENFLQQRGVSVCGIHGDLRQDQRTRSLEAFKSGSTPVLVATDVAARGLDIPEVKLVVNVTFPLTIEDYVHRIGRTGRAGKTGEAITFFTQQDKAHSGSLINILKGANQPVPDELFKFGTTVKKKAHDTYGAFFKDVDMTKKATKIVFD
ncbi:DEAD-domain-containing protein [Sodiomyces alkalinus F11]|uniref:RNA helicase n=1 Tax=Sodiomyces alkalinus (strain CBS 110278 / VKM F-3762 / F11) TaxID=1314773 RepID=A0A3N2PPV4_SODAK|nr:DEAD-domain-containing protein [Sodiomyces alkalinus F11]ROT36542.1 DEAD-domain-containing protein [Sodiomyces alkalinus F11]